MNPTLSVLLSFLLLPAVACNGAATSGIPLEEDGSGGTGAGGRASSVGAPGSGGAAPVDPKAGPLERACVDSCKNERDCGRAVSDSCERSCVDGGRLFSGSCQTLIANEAACTAKLDCGALDTYLNARSGDANCGDAFDAFAKACTLDSGTIPGECSAYCETAVRCNASTLDAQGCAEACLLSLSGLQARYGDSCANVERDAYACFGGLDCTGMKALASGSVPAQCKELETSWKNTCR